MGNLIRSTNLWGYDDLVRSLDADPAPFRARYGIAPGVEDVDEAFVPFADVSRLLEATADALDCPDLGLRLVRWQGLGILGPVAVIARNAATVRGGVGDIARFLHAHSPALHLSTGEPDGDGHVRFHYEITELPLVEQRQSYELSMANATRIIRMLGGPDAEPTSIAFVHEQMGPAAAYDEALGCRVEFGSSWCGFVVDQAVLDRPIDAADPQTRRIATAYLEAHRPRQERLTDQVASLVRRLLPTGQCTVDAVAEQLHLHPRTLQRQLVAERTTYAEIVDTERRDLAVHYLAEPNLQLGQVATLLGYAEQSTFNRSFRRWFDTTPRAHRAAMA